MSVRDGSQVKQQLRSELFRVRSYIDALSVDCTSTEPGEFADAVEQAGHQFSPALRPSSTPVRMLEESFHLSPFERDLLLLCAGPELDSGFGKSIQRANKSPDPRPSFGLALAALPGAHWSAITPMSPLRRWRMIEPDPGSLLSSRPLRIDERVLHHLTGLKYLDSRLEQHLRQVSNLHPGSSPLDSYAELIASAWRGQPSARAPILQLNGRDQQRSRLFAAQVASNLGLSLLELSVPLNVSQPADRDLISRLIERESVLGSHALFVDARTDLELSTPEVNELSRFVERLEVPLFVCGLPVLETTTRQTITVDVPSPNPSEVCSELSDALPGGMVGLNGRLDRVLTDYRIDSGVISQIRSRVEGQSLNVDADGRDLENLVRQTIREHYRPRLDEIAQRLEPAADWNDLILPDSHLETLRTITIHVRNRSTVYDEWGFRERGERGLGISALFSGASGTGKTMAAEVIANELEFDLYRIDLASIVSKYIGETEKNLRKVFGAAEGAGAILLFDEADALFGKRSEVSDSHDRYANIEVSYLLQRMESYRGLAILTTNLRNSLDSAFTRRIRFALNFPFPDRVQRMRIWEQVFPARTPVDGLDWDRLSSLNVTGGTIRNIAMNAAFFAAAEQTPVRMSHVLEATRQEYMKLERTLTETELACWE